MKKFDEFLKDWPADVYSRLSAELGSDYGMIPDPEVISFVDSLEKGELVESVDLHLLQKFNTSTFWRFCKTILGFVSPTLIWARTFKEIVVDSRVLEVCSGTGLFAKYLDAVGIDIIATDNMSWHSSPDRDWKLYFPVEKLDFRDAISMYPADYLLMCWPPYESSLAYEAAKLFSSFNPKGLIICISEGKGGCVADDDFFDNTESVRKIDNSLFPQWWGLYDYVSLRKWNPSKLAKLISEYD